MRNMQFIFNQDGKTKIVPKVSALDCKHTMVDIELEADALPEDEIEFDRVGSLGSEESTEIPNPYKKPESKERTYTFVDHTNFSYFRDDTMQQIQKVQKKEKITKESFYLQNGEMILSSSSSSSQNDSFSLTKLDSSPHHLCLSIID